MNGLSLEVIFDYACPYCYKAHLYLKEIRTEFPELQFIFSPCEAHPRPERWSPHSDLALQGMYFCMEYGIDVWEYHDLTYRAFHVDRINAENIDVLSAYLADLLDVEELYAAIQSGKYEARRLDANRYAWETLSLHAVPSYRMEERILKAASDIGVSKPMLLEFIENEMICSIKEFASK